MSPLSLRDGLPPAEKFAALPLKNLKVGWLGNYGGYLEMEPGILGLCESALQVLEGHGSIVGSCAPQYELPRLWETWLTLRHWSANWVRPLYDDAARRQMLKPEIVFEVEGSLGLTAERVYAAGVARSEWFRALGQLFEHYDFLALPSAQVFPFPKDLHWPPRINDREMDTYHRWMEVVIGGTLAGLPIVNVPVGSDARGRPMGMQLMGCFGEDRRVLEFGLAYEEVTGFLDRRPALQEPAKLAATVGPRESYPGTFAR